MKKIKEKPSKRKKNQWARLFLSLFVGLSAAAITLLILMLLDGRHKEFFLLGEEHVRLEYGEDYTDPGVEILTVGRLLPSFIEPERVYARQTPDTRRLGTQELEYLIASNGKEYRLTRYLEIVDSVPPQIELTPIPDGEEPSWLRGGYIEPGYRATDNVDGDLTASVAAALENDRVVYTVADRSGNTAQVERLLPAGLDAPVIELVGGETLRVPSAMSWEDPGFHVTDGKGTDLSALVTVEGEVIAYRSGDYELVYRLENALGEEVVARRTVTVEPVRQSDTVIPDQKTIYLTFDDGPGPYTGWLLDVLARYNVKATFFVTGNQKDYRDCITRAHEEGHTVAVHSMTHNYYGIYASEEAFLEDFMACEDMIYELTGSYTNVFRFPGGSSNTVSRFNPGIMSRLATMMPDMGYYYFDWNVDSNDAGGASSSDEVYWNVVGGCSHGANVVLQHDIKDFSVAAVERIIIWGLNNGYQFLPLDGSSYGAHHGLNN